MGRIDTGTANVQDVKRLHLIVLDRCGTEGQDSIGRRADRETAREFFTALSGMWIAVREESASARAGRIAPRRAPRSLVTNERNAATNSRVTHRRSNERKHVRTHHAVYQSRAAGSLGPFSIWDSRTGQQSIRVAGAPLRVSGSALPESLPGLSDWQRVRRAATAAAVATAASAAAAAAATGAAVPAGSTARSADPGADRTAPATDPARSAPGPAALAISADIESGAGTGQLWLHISMGQLTADLRRTARPHHVTRPARTAMNVACGRLATARPHVRIEGTTTTGEILTWQNRFSDRLIRSGPRCRLRHSDTFRRRWQVVGCRLVHRRAR